MTSDPRPLSPHLQVYRWQLTSVLSILHRLSGIALTVGTLLLVWWLVSAAQGPESYRGIQNFLGSWLGRLLLFEALSAQFTQLRIRRDAEGCPTCGDGVDLENVEFEDYEALCAAAG